MLLIVLLLSVVSLFFNLLTFRILKGLCEDRSKEID